MPAAIKFEGRILSLAQIAGIAVTGWLVWSNAVLPRLRWESAASLATQACFYVMLAWIGATVMAFAVYFVVSPAELPEAAGFSLRSAAPAMWFAPAIILASAPIPAAFFISAILVATATRQLIVAWFVPGALGYAAGKPAAAMAASCAAQLGLVAELWNRPALAAALLAGGAAMVTSLAMASGAYRPTKETALPHSLWSVVVAFLLAVSVSYGGLRAARATGHGAHDDGPPATEYVTRLADPPAGSMAPDGDFPGVILLPEARPQATLLIPPLTAPISLNAPITRPVGLPFSGEYWMFRSPAARPPARSFVRHGTPVDLSFHTTDGWAMHMEAHQRLEPPADAHCCTGIQLVVHQAEILPVLVSLEVVLIDSHTRSLQSLGSVAAEPGQAMQTLTYSIPAVTSLAKFDEIKVVFQRRDAGIDKSSKVAIERFLLLP